MTYNQRRIDPTLMHQPEFPVLAIIICSWNTCEILDDCLQSIYQHPPNVTFEVWVVDNASKDSSVQMVKSKYPQVRLIENSQNVGFAGANNQAIQQSQSQYVLLLNSDTLVYPGTFDYLLDFLISHERVGAAGSRYLNPNGTLQRSCYPFPTISRELWRLLKLDILSPYGTYSMNSWPVDQARPVDILQGASLILKRAAIDEVGILDETYFMYSEEVDLCYRLKKAGWDLYWVPQSVILHYGGQSTKQISEEMFLQLYKSKLLFFKKHYGAFATELYKIVLTIASFVRVVGGSILGRIDHKHQNGYAKLVKNYKNLLNLIFKGEPQKVSL